MCRESAWIVVVNPLEDGGDLAREIFDNQGYSSSTATLEQIQHVLTVLTQLEYEISWYDIEPEELDD